MAPIAIEYQQYVVMQFCNLKISLEGYSKLKNIFTQCEMYHIIKSQEISHQPQTSQDICTPDAQSTNSTIIGRSSSRLSINILANTRILQLKALSN